VNNSDFKCFLEIGREPLSLIVGQVMSSTLLVLRRRKRAYRVQYESVEFVVIESRQTATNLKMSRDVADVTDMMALRM